MSKFGIELEYSIVDDKNRPILNSNTKVQEIWNQIGLPDCLELEYGSFQIEINPGPWDLNEKGIELALNEIQTLEDHLRGIVHDLKYNLSSAALLPVIKKEDINSQDFITKEPKFFASINYFSNRSCTLKFRNGEELLVPADKIIACINEIHFNISLNSDSETLHLFNYLNKIKFEPCDQFKENHVVNDKYLQNNCTTMSLFYDVNHEWDTEGKVSRVGFIPYEISSYNEYEVLLNKFNAIPLCNEEDKYLDLNSSVYFWTRLHNGPTGLRVEYRPMEMGKDWKNRSLTFLSLIQDFNRVISF